MSLPNYPIDFHDCHRSKRMTEEMLHTKINQEIEKMIFFMNENKTNNHSVSFEDVLIIIDRIYEDDDCFFEISVAKEHSKLRVKA
ncbi:hypothetical protein [Halalkalibacter urbisdiaboli]|uniref:hypothetical protein n=1 Tax=Halalkalibacter urbisdiaboli TaxID=1960589 RepID=UPI000B43944A|nr:hypothetical protein [Halalkalibacter urbisdiaboli]